MIFTTESVKAILEGRKTQTRRVFKKHFTFLVHRDGQGSRIGRVSGVPVLRVPFENEDGEMDWYETPVKCPYGAPGDRLWVKETWRPCQVPQCGDSQCVEWLASERCKKNHFATLNRKGWKSPLFMPRSASRLTLEIVNIRVELLQSISEDDARAEGVDSVDEYKTLWDKINGKKHPWIANPWVWVVEVKV